MTQLNIVVIGAGVVGLTTALQLLRRGHRVSVIAEHLPGEMHPDYTSPWAGAHWRSMAEPEDTLQRELDARTFEKFMELVHTVGREAGLMTVTATDYFAEKPTGWTVPWFHGLVPEFRMLDKHELLEGTVFGYTYRTFTVNTAVYLKWLQSNVEKHGGVVCRARLANWWDALSIASQASSAAQLQQVVVNCTGNGARYLGGIGDTDVYPTRGQTVLIRSHGLCKTYALHGHDTINYAIPRDDGTVVLGGTYQHHNSNINPDPATAERIIKSATTVFPELINPNTGKVDIICHAVGLRPSRVGGVRLEAETKELKGKPMLLVHNYGHGGQGYQSSWASADKVVQLIEQQLPAIPTRSRL
ncbi:hypothetical protein THASP1DRAFT_33480 [Thamnocephalis sphaerospora]|uniref:FAD dependent oxidoreductase domain-containing protein n=1 Tax=Thamnocephalis sphaerospora TaxID=78915 RepID=A0A4P9XGH5_9FUNG|nr:hypothetical protein THASP1DRAFT_33480 [Thamnocephalis sphaerospora]|eukprot:RKP04717.1 hypothetical protein THASP1DRAFT_33480 [Thamnocephalis sphaerospora]